MFVSSNMMTFTQRERGREGGRKRERRKEGREEKGRKGKEK